MAYWLFKSEPETWSWDDHARDGVAEWDGVRNHQANNHMKHMKKGDRAFFYHSGAARQVVGIAEVAKTWYLDPSDDSGRFGMVDLKTIAPLKKPVDLATIKTHPKLSEMVLVKNARLSVQPVRDAEWRIVCQLGGAKP